jgi:hypothetical protein
MCVVPCTHQNQNKNIMQKVITLTGRQDILGGEDIFIETQHPEINKLLEDGFAVIETIPIIKTSDQAYWYSITFILEREEDPKA